MNIIKLPKTIIDQNYFQFLDKTYLHTEGLAMGVPTSSICSVFYLEYLEKTKVYNLLLKHNILGSFCYVNDILIICNINKSNKNNVLNNFSKLVSKPVFNIEKETNCNINLLDINNTIQQINK
jgi:hypothetical protein